MPYFRRTHDRGGKGHADAFDFADSDHKQGGAVSALKATQNL
jgi:hypothetical protein